MNCFYLIYYEVFFMLLISYRICSFFGCFPRQFATAAYRSRADVTTTGDPGVLPSSFGAPVNVRFGASNVGFFRFIFWFVVINNSKLSALVMHL